MATPLRRLACLTAFATFALAAAGAGGSGWSRPLEIAVLDSGEAVVLLADGRLVAFDTRSARPRWRQVHQVGDLGLQPVDVELAVLDGEPTAIVLLFRDARHSFLLRVGLRSGASPPVPALVGRGPAGSLALRPGGNEALITSLSDRSVYGMELAGRSPEAKVLFSLPPGMRPGVVAVRSVRPEIVLSEVDSDVLYLARLPDGALTPLRTVDGLIRSIALDPQGRFAYVAEGRHGSIWRVDLANAQAAPRELLKRGTVRDAVDLAVDGSGRLWLVDEAGAAVFVLDPQTRALRRVFQW